MLDFDGMTCHWRAIGRTSQLFDEGNGGHFSINIFEFTETSRKHLYESKIVVCGENANNSIPVPREHFELKSSRPAIPDGVLCAPHYHHSLVSVDTPKPLTVGADAGTEGMSSAKWQPTVINDRCCEDLGRQTHEPRTHCQVEDHYDQIVVGASRFHAEELHGSGSGTRGLPEDFPSSSCSDGFGKRDGESRHQRSNCGQESTSGLRTDNFDSGHVQSRTQVHESSWEQEPGLADVRQFPIKVGAPQY